MYLIGPTVFLVASPKYAKLLYCRYGHNTLYVPIFYFFTPNVDAIC